MRAIRRDIWVTQHAAVTAAGTRPHASSALA